ncbi:MAG: hypothetical protein PVH61_30870 [Candidatus Aminicenantes bacterium]|jgi:hypothetical protein
MSYIEDYNRKIEVIKAIPDDQIKSPKNTPTGISIQEALNLYHWCQDDKEELTAKGLDWTVVEDMPIRCGALYEAELKWHQEQSLRRKAEKIWVRESLKGYALRKELIHHFNFAFRHDSSLIKKVKEIAKKSTNDCMIHGLYDLNTLGRDNQDLLKKIGFDFTLLDLAAKKSDELATKNAAASFDRKDYLEAKTIRNQAYTHLKEAVDLIRECGKFVFCRNAYRLKGYRSNHLRRIRLRNTRRKKLSLNVSVSESENPEPDQ